MTEESRDPADRVEKLYKEWDEEVMPDNQADTREAFFAGYLAGIDRGLELADLNYGMWREV